MPSDQGASFIPKRNPSKKIKRVVTRRVYLFTFVTYIVLFVVLILSASLFGYKLYLEGEIATQIKNLNQEIDSFKVADMQRVIEYEQRLALAEDRFANQISMATLIALLESTTAQTIQYTNVSIERPNDSEVLLAADIIAREFDSAVFQREVYEQTDELSGVVLEDISFTVGGGSESNSRVVSVTGDTLDTITMMARFRLNPGSFPAIADDRFLETEESVLNEDITTNTTNL